jgi:hypothetical protein
MLEKQGPRNDAVDTVRAYPRGYDRLDYDNDNDNDNDNDRVTLSPRMPRMLSRI